MNTYYIVRHGKTVWNTEKRTQGQKNSELTEQGIEHARQFSRKISHMHIDEVYSSDLKRAYETAKIIRPSSEIHLEKGFREINFGLWEGLTIEEIQKNYSELYSSWQTSPEEVAFIEGEKIVEAFERVNQAFWEIDSKHENKHILIVAHAMVIKLLLVGFLDAPINKIFNIVQGNLAMNIVKKKNKKATIVTMNDTSYLD